jgi:hypothetical protein
MGSARAASQMNRDAMATSFGTYPIKKAERLRGTQHGSESIESLSWFLIGNRKDDHFAMYGPTLPIPTNLKRGMKKKSNVNICS